MRPEDEVEEFRTRTESIADRERRAALVAAFEACVPRDFWDVEDADITHNREVFDAVVKPYCAKLKTARRRGYGLLFFGDNGAGKTIFMSYVLMEAIRRKFTAYYTTMPQLDHDLKRGFNDRTAAQRLDWMLSSDFMVLDELGKERHRDGDAWSRGQVERVLKQRFDNSLCTLIGTNASLESLTEMYGESVASVFAGKYENIQMESGDYREKIRERMESEMKYG